MTLNKGTALNQGKPRWVGMGSLRVKWAVGQTVVDILNYIYIQQIGFEMDPSDVFDVFRVLLWRSILVSVLFIHDVLVRTSPLRGYMTIL